MLLIVGALLSALQPPISMVWIFILFVFSAIVYYIVIHQEHTNNLPTNVFAILCAFFFSAILAYNLGYSLGMVLGLQYLTVVQGIAWLYYFLITVILYKALAKGKWLQKPSPSKKKEKLKTETGWKEHPAFVE